jgi:hypothetical protein
MSKNLSGLLGDEQWKRCQELLRPREPEVPEVQSIRTYVKDKRAVVEENRTQQPDQNFVVRKTTSPLSVSSRGSSVAHPSPLAGSCGSGEPDEEDWMQSFVALQEPDLKPWIVHDRSKRFCFSQVSFKGARHENQDTLFRSVWARLLSCAAGARHRCASLVRPLLMRLACCATATPGPDRPGADDLSSDGQMFSVFDGHGGASAARYASSGTCRACRVELPQHASRRERCTDS